MALIAPSIFSADFARLDRALRIVERAGGRTLHLEVMDGHFVPDITAGQPVIQSLRNATDLELSIHLLVERPERFIEDMARAGADRIAIHAEATPNPHRALERVRATGRKAGLALHPGTPVEDAADSFPAADYLVILTADLRLGERRFIQGMTGKVSRAARERRRGEVDFEIMAAGGIGFSEVGALVDAGADILVVDSAIFNSRDPEQALREMIQGAARAGLSDGDTGQRSRRVLEKPVPES